MLSFEIRYDRCNDEFVRLWRRCNMCKHSQCTPPVVIEKRSKSSGIKLSSGYLWIIRQRFYLSRREMIRYQTFIVIYVDIGNRAEGLNFVIGSAMRVQRHPFNARRGGGGFRLAGHGDKLIMFYLKF